MNVQANARASAASRVAHSIPVLRASDVCGNDGQVRMLALFATYPQHAPTIVAELEQKARYHRLDGTLRDILSAAKATVKRGANRRMH